MSFVPASVGSKRQSKSLLYSTGKELARCDMATKRTSIIFALAVLCVSAFSASDVSAYNPTLYSTQDYPWYDGSEPANTTLFRETQIQLCSIGIWDIWEQSDLVVGSGLNPQGTPLYSGILGATRPTGSQIVSQHGAGTYYFQSYNSSGCGGIDDEPFGVSSWAYFTVNPDGSFVNAFVNTATSTVALENITASTTYQTRIENISMLKNDPVNDYIRIPGDESPNNPIKVEMTNIDHNIVGWSTIPTGYFSLWFDDGVDGFLVGCEEMSSKSVGGYATFPNVAFYDVYLFGFDGGIEKCGDISQYTSEALIASDYMLPEGTGTSPLIWEVTSDVEMTVGYFLNTSEINTSVSYKNPTNVSVCISKRPQTDFECLGTSIDTTLQGNATATIQFYDLVDGVYDVQAKYSNFGCTAGLSECPFPLAYVMTTMTIENGVVDYQGIELYDNRTPPPIDNVYEECGLTNIAGCINNSFRFLFVPSETLIDELVAVKDIASNKAPFAYAVDMTQVLTELTQTANAQTLDMTVDLGFGEITIIDQSMIESAPYASTIRQLLVYLLWLSFAFAMYRIALSIHDHDNRTI